MSCEHDWDEIPDDKEFYVGCAGECLYKNVRCVKCGAEGKEVWSWVEIVENSVWEEEYE
jgi:hypothetical protein